MPEVLSRSGVPIVSDFANGKGTPLVVNTNNGRGYVLKDGDTVIPIGADTVDLRDFDGVDPTGTNDSTSAIASAVAQAITARGRLYAKSGTYILSSQISINGTIMVDGDGWGTIFKVDASATRFIPFLVQGTSYAAVNGVVFRNFKMDGSSKGLLDAGLLQINNGIAFLADHLWVTSGGTPGESSSQGVNGISASAGAIGEAGSQGTITHCLIEATTKAGINLSTQSLNVLVEGNIVRNCTGNTQTPGIQVLGGINTQLKSNFIYSNQGYGIFAATTGTGPWYNTMYCLIEGNHVYSNGQGSTVGEGILIANSAASSSQFGRYIIRGNHVYSNGVNVNGHGIHVQNDNNILLESNYCYNNSLNGIMVEACQNVKVFNNICESNNTANTSNGAGIYVKSNSSATLGTIEISRNRSMNAGNQKYPIYYDNSAAQSVSDVIITDNTSSGHTTSDGLNFDYALPQRFQLRHRRSGQTTANATPANIFYALVRDNSAAMVSVKTVAVKDDGSARAMYSRSGLIYRDGGGATVEGALQTAYEVESDATWDQTINVSGNFVQAQVTGVAATNITWDSLVEIQAE